MRRTKLQIEFSRYQIRHLDFVVQHDRDPKARDAAQAEIDRRDRINALVEKHCSRAALLLFAIGGYCLLSADPTFAAEIAPPADHSWIAWSMFGAIAATMALIGVAAMRLPRDAEEQERQNRECDDFMRQRGVRREDLSQ